MAPKAGLGLGATLGATSCLAGRASSGKSGRWAKAESKPETTAKARPELGLPSSMDHSSWFRPYPARAHVNDLRFQLRSHPALPPPGGKSETRVSAFRCPLPKPPCRPWPCSLALQSHTSQDRTGQARSLLSLPIAVMPLRRVFGARPARPPV